MSRGRRRAAWLLGFVAAASCVWDDAVVETRPVSGERPAEEVAADREQAVEPFVVPPPPAPPAGAAETPPAATSTGATVEEAVPPPGPLGDAGQDVAVPAAQVAMLDGGLLVVAPSRAPGFAGAPGLLRLTLPVGLRAGKPGLAELAAEVAVDLKLPTRPGGSLRGALARIGASIEVRVARAATSLDVAFPAGRYREVLELLASYLVQPLDPAVPAETFDALRVGLAARLGREWLRAPMSAMVDRMRTGRTRALADVISQISLRTAAEVAVFQRAHYLAPGCVLAMWVPGATQADLVIGVAASMPPWLDARKGAGLMPLLTPPPAQTGVFWAPYEGPVQVAVFVPQPSLDQPLAAEMLVLLECLTHDGLAGRLGLALEGLVGRDVSFDLLSPGETDQIALVARADEKVVVPLWEAVSQVLGSFRTRPPADAELRDAAARARFRLMEEVSRPDGWLRLVSRLAYRRATPDVLAKTLARLAVPSKLELEAAVPLFADTPVALAVVGGEPPVQAPRLVQLMTDGVLPRARAGQLVPPGDLRDSRKEAERYMATAVDAFGGKDALRELHGYREVVVSDTGVGPSVETTTWFRDDGRLRQEIRILATTVTATIDTSGGVETSQGRREPVAVDEARSRLTAAARHPSMLVARFARGETEFRLLTLRVVAGREQAVLEEIGGGPDTVRLTLDTQVGLVRALEVRTWNPEVGAIVVREEFSDYRTIGGLVRAPFLRTRSLDEGEPTHALRTLEFDAAAPTDEALK